MTLHARHCDVSTGERKARLLVPRNTECRRAEALHQVTVFTTIQVRRTGELLAVRVGVAIHAKRKLHFVVCCLPGRHVTLRAGHGRVLALERIGRCGVFFHREIRWLESLDAVAGSTITAVRALGELPTVRVGRVAIGALPVRHRLFEICRAVTLVALHGRMFSFQRVICFRMVKFPGERNGFPSAGVVAALTGGDEGAAVRIGVARGAFVEGHAGELHHFFRSAARQVTFLAGHMFMAPGERIARLRVVEARERFPAVHVVAALAIAPELAAVRIGMADEAIARQSEEGARQQLLSDEAPLGFGDVLRRMTFLAVQPGVLSLQRVAGLGVVKPFGRGIPLDEIEIFAVVFGVAGNAGFAGGALREQRRMQAAIFLETIGNERVAVQALEGGASGTELVTRGAHGRPGTGLMRAGKRSRRDLRIGLVSEKGREQQHQEQSAERKALWRTD